MNDRDFRQEDDGTLSFLPNRLNIQPVVVGGLTNDELFATVIVSAGAGFLIGLPLAFVLTPGMPFYCATAAGFLGLSVASRILRRLKRGRPETWLWQQVEWRLAGWGLAGKRLITRSGAWTVKRMEGL